MLLIYTVKSAKSVDSDRRKIKSDQMKHTGGSVVSCTAEPRCVNVDGGYGFNFGIPE